MRPAMPDMPGDKYRMIELLGKGGFAAVYRALDPAQALRIAAQVGAALDYAHQQG